MSLCHVTKFSFYLSQFTVGSNIFKKISRFMPVLSIRICFGQCLAAHFLIWEFSIWIWRLPFALNISLRAQIIDKKKNYIYKILSFPLRFTCSSATTLYCHSEKNTQISFNLQLVMVFICCWIPFSVLTMINMNVWMTWNKISNCIQQHTWRLFPSAIYVDHLAAV